METIQNQSSTLDSTADSIEQIEKSVYLIKLGDLNYEKSMELAEEYKEAGNKLINENKYVQAAEKFTEAIDLGIETPRNAIYYSNRAFCNIKLENYGLAISDANKAIEIDKDYIKAYYRRYNANIILMHYDESIADLEILCKKFPDDQGLKNDMIKVKQERKRKKFLESIVSERSEEK